MKLISHIFYCNLLHISQIYLNNQKKIEDMNQQIQPLRRSRRLATIIPASHWMSIGFTLEDATSMECLQNDIKKYCEEEDESIIILRVKDISGEFRGDIALPNHELLLPHWNKLMKALHGRDCVNEFHLSAVHPPWELESIFPTLQSLTNMTSLKIGVTGLGEAGYLRLSSFIKENTSLKIIGLCGETIDSLSVANSLSDALQSHPNLEGVAFIQCGLDNVDFLGRIFEGCKGINGVGVNGEEFGSECIAVISKFIGSNHHAVETINLGENNISDEDTNLLAAALKTNTNLRRLALKNNDITQEGVKVLMSAIYDRTSMDSIVDSNHSCIPHTFCGCDHSAIAELSDLERSIFRINQTIEFSIGQKIRKKVVLALCGLEGELFDLGHLNDLPLEVMPRVLELIQEHTEARTLSRCSVHLEIDALSRLFHTLRGWDVPLLFGNLRKPPESVATRTRKRGRSARR